MWALCKQCHGTWLLWSFWLVRSDSNYQKKVEAASFGNPKNWDSWEGQWVDAKQFLHIQFIISQNFCSLTQNINSFQILLIFNSCPWLCGMNIYQQVSKRLCDIHIFIFLSINSQHGYPVPIFSQTLPALLFSNVTKQQTTSISLLVGQKFKGCM